MSWLTEKEKRRVSLVAALVGTLAGGLSDQTLGLAGELLGLVLKLSALW